MGVAAKNHLISHLPCDGKKAMGGIVPTFCTSQKIHFQGNITAFGCPGIAGSFGGYKPILLLPIRIGLGGQYKQISLYESL